MYIGAVAMGQAEYGEGSGPVSLDDVKCEGDESHILGCPQKARDAEHNCQHSEDAGVKCAGGSKFLLQISQSKEMINRLTPSSQDLVVATMEGKLVVTAVMVVILMLQLSWCQL